jgi:hypothetical protein
MGIIFCLPMFRPDGTHRLFFTDILSLAGQLAAVDNFSSTHVSSIKGQMAFVFLPIFRPYGTDRFC